MRRIKHCMQFVYFGTAAFSILMVITFTVRDFWQSQQFAANFQRKSTNNHNQDGSETTFSKSFESLHGKYLSPEDVAPMIETANCSAFNIGF